MSRDVDEGCARDTLAALLNRLDDDREAAGVKYESLRRTLTRFFDWRGVAHPDEAADESLVRLGRRVAAGEPVADVRSYALGIARLVCLEQLRNPRVVPLDDTTAGDLPALDRQHEDTAQIDCFERCLRELPDEGRRLILGYYTHERHGQIAARARLAQELNLSANALRSRAQRVRDRLESCVRECAGHGADRSTDTKGRATAL